MVIEIQTSADPAVLWLRAGQLCCLGGHAPDGGEIIGILQKLKDQISAVLADSQNPDEVDRKSDNATLVAAKVTEVATLSATIETNLRQCDLGVEVDSTQGDLAETDNSLAGDEASSEREERQKSRADPQSMRRFLWPCDSTGGRAHSATRMLWFFCNFKGRKIKLTNSKTLVGWSMSRPAVSRVPFDLARM